jgi:hypothetical protein
MKISEAQLNDLRLRALTAIDGLWFLAVEKKLGFEVALELDLDVWKNYGLIILKRLTRMLGLEIEPGNPPELETVNFLLQTLCRIDGTVCSGEVRDESTAVFHVHRCSWWENLRRAGREKIIPCEMIDNAIFRHWLDAVDPTIEMEIVHSLPRGDDRCTWILRRAIPTP